MNPYRKITPEGSRDLLFEECAAQNRVKELLMNLFCGRGYREVMPPTLEYCDLFTLPGAEIPLEEMYKITDRWGRLLVLRPDVTTPIARITAARLKEHPLPLRLCYTQKAYRTGRGYHGEYNECTQSGIELIGAQGMRADLEVLALAVEALRVCGAPDFRIEIGHAGFFKELTSELPAGEAEIEELRWFIEQKNYAAIDQFLKPFSDCSATPAIRKLARWFGGDGVLSEALALCPAQAKAPIEEISEIFSRLQTLGLKDKISIDLGLVHRNSYYTGIVFRGYVEGSGATVLSGGRYDRLHGLFGRSLAAVGFALDNDALARTMLERGDIAPEKPADVLVHAEPGFEMEALTYAGLLAKEGLVCAASTFSSMEEAIQCARQQGISRMDRVGEQVETCLL